MSLTRVTTALQVLGNSETIVQTTSSNWNSCYTTINANSSVFTNVQSNSANWNNTFTNVNANSARWQNVYTNVNANSSRWFSTTVLYAYSEKTSNYTVTSNDMTIVLLSGSYTFTLPYASSVVNQVFNIKNLGTGILTISAADLIDGSYTQTLIQQYKSLQLQSGSNKWVIL